MTSKYEKLRALFLSALMVVSVFGATMAFAGAGAATAVANDGATDPGSQGPAAGASNVAVMELGINSEDTIVNNDDGTDDAEAGDAVGSLPSDGSVRYVEQGSDSSYNAGDELYRDDDNDDVYTGSADQAVGGTAPSATTSVNNNVQDSDWDIDSIDASDDGNPWDGSSDTLLLDNDEDSAYTANADNLVNGTTSNLAAGDALTDGGSLPAEWVGTTAGDIYHIDSNDDGGNWDPAADAIYIEGGGSAGAYNSGDDTLLAGAGPADGATGSQGLDSTDWVNINVYDDVGGDDYDSSADAIVEDFHYGGTYSAESDTVVGGTTPADGATGAQYTSGGFDGDWSLDSIDGSTTDSSWDPSIDTIIIDVGDRGTYSAAADTQLNAGNDGTWETTDGENSGVPDTSVNAYVDVDDSGDLTAGDEIYTEGDSGTLGTDNFGDAVGTITVQNGGTLSAQYIDSVKLFAEDTNTGLAGADDTLLASTSSQSNGQWVLDAGNDYFGTSAQTYYVAVDLASDAPETETLQFEVPSVSDGSTTGSYDSGDTGLFFAQASPTGQITNPEAITVNNPPESLSIDAPSSLSYYQNDETITVSYNYNDEYPSLAKVKLDDADDSSTADSHTYTIQDGEYTDNGNVKTVTLDLSEYAFQDGAYNIELTAEDENGATTTITSSNPLVGIDTTSPDLSNAGVTDNTDVDTTWTVDIVDDETESSGLDTSAISATVTDTSSNTDVVSGTVATSSALSFSSGTLTIDPSSSYDDDTTYDVEVDAPDNAGNQVSNTYANDFTILSQDPAISSVEAEAGSNEATVTFNEGVNAEDGTLSADDFSYEDNNSNAGATGITGVQDFSQGDSSATLVFDSAVVAGDLDSDVVAARENAIDDADDDGNFVGLTNVKLQDTESNFAFNQNDITASDIDVDNHQSYSVGIDFTSIDEPVDIDLNITGSGAPEVNATQTDVTSDTSFTGLDVSGFDDGTVDVSITVDDKSPTEDHSVTESVQVDKDTAPVLTGVNNADAGSDTFDVNFDIGVEDANGDALSADNFTFTNGTNGAAQNISSVSHTAGDDTATITLNASLTESDLGADEIGIAADTVYNEDGTTAASEQSVVVTDTTAPSPVNIVSPSDGAELLRTPDGTMQLTYNYTETNPSEVIVFIDGQPVTLDDSDYSDNGTDKTVTLDLSEFTLADGTYDVTVNVKDANGNSVAAANTDVLRVDGSAPSVTLNDVTPVGGTTSSPQEATTSDTLEVDFSYFDSSDGTATVTVLNDDNDIVYENSVSVTEANNPYTESIDLSSLSGISDNSQITVDVSAGDAVGYTSGTQSQSVNLNDAAPAIESVDSNAGSSQVTVTFTEDVIAADSALSADDFYYEDVSADGASAVDSVVSSESDTVKLDLDSAVGASDVGADEIGLNAGAVNDIAGEPISAESVALSESPPGVVGIEAKHNDTTVRVEFDESVYAASDGTGALTADDFNYTDANGQNASSIESVSYGADDDVVLLTLNNSVSATDLGNDTVDIEANEIYDVAGLAVGSQSLTLGDTLGPELTLAAENTNNTVNVTVTAREKLDTLEVDVDGQNDLATDVNATFDPASSYTLTASHFSENETANGYEYEASVDVDEDNVYDVDTSSATDTSGNARVNYDSDAVTVDETDPSVDNAVITDADGSQTEITVRLDEGVEGITADDVTIAGATVDSVGTFHASEGLLTVNVDGELQTGDSPVVDIDGGQEVAGDTVVDDITTIHTDRLYLNAGQNFISVPAASGTLDVSELESQVGADNIEVIWTYESGSWQSYNPDASEQDITELEGGQGYIVTLNSGAVADVNVNNIVTGGSAEESNPGAQTLSEGWNLVGHWQEGQQSQATALATLDSLSPHTAVYAQQGTGYQYQVVTGGNFEPGNAYWVFVQDDDDVYTEAQYAE